jgi:hypothetical protein
VVDRKVKSARVILHVGLPCLCVTVERDLKEVRKEYPGRKINNNNSMITFKEFTQNRPILGVVEIIDIKGIGRVEAKIDSGNEAYNVLLGLNIKHNKDGTCTFDTVNDMQLTLPCTGSIDINIGSSNIESRPTVKLTFKLKDIEYKDITFSLADRKDNDQPVLIGEPFVREINALIDVKR